MAGFLWLYATCAGKDLAEPAYNCKSLKNGVGMRGIRKLVGKVLSGPMFIMFAVSPEAAFGHIIYNALISYPYLRLILPVTQGQL